MEHGISSGAGIGMNLRTRRIYTHQQAVTEHILTVAGRAGYGAALIDAVAIGPDGASVVTWPQFVHMVRTAAHALSRRGLHEADTAAVFVQDAVSHVLAVHAVRAAGANAAPVRPAPTAADIAAQLKQSRARLLITSAALADVAIQATERSWVRQVFAFGEAEGTTPFGPLLGTARHGQLQANGYHGDSVAAQALDFTAAQALDFTAAQALDPSELGFLLDGPVLPLTSRDVVVAAPPGGDPDIYTALLDLALAASATVVAAPLAQVAAAVKAYKGTAAIVPRGTDVAALPAERIFGVG